MKRKRKAEDDDHPGHSLDASGKKREDRSAASGPIPIPIDLTLSEGEDDDQQRVEVKVKNTVILSDSEGDQDRDEVLFLKEASSSKSNGVQAEASIASNTKTINDILRDKNRPSSRTIPKSLPPLLLSTPAQVAKHTPCTLHYDILPSSLANRLYLKMIDESTSWKKNKWYLNDRLVESSHKTCFYTSSSHKRDDGKVDEQWYMGRKMEEEEDGKGRLFLEEMEEAREIIEEFVNERLKEKKRYDMEYDGSWKANVAASNCYRGGAEVG